AEAAPEHPLLGVRPDGALAWQRTEELRARDFIAVQRGQAPLGRAAEIRFAYRADRRQEHATAISVEELHALGFSCAEISDIEDGQANVYDLTVPGSHSFCANGFVNHNTYLAMAMAIAELMKNSFARIILTRPAVEAGEKLGFLPGDLAEKVNPYLRPLYDALLCGSPVGCADSPGPLARQGPEGAHPARDARPAAKRAPAPFRAAHTECAGQIRAVRCAARPLRARASPRRRLPHGKYH